MQTVRTINVDGSIGACPNCSDIHIIDADGNYNLAIEQELILKRKNHYRYLYVL